MNPEKIRKDFSILQQKKPPIYFDSACMSLRPNQVVQAQTDYYEQHPACAGRSAHYLAEQVTEKFETARRTIAKFAGAKKHQEIIFTKNTTEAINLVANSFGLKKGDTVLVSNKEHNSNLIPWLYKKKKLGINVKFFEHGNLDDFEKKIKGVTLVSTNAISNFDGSHQDVKEMTKIAHKNGAKIIIDAAQMAPHEQMQAKKLDVDFLAFSGHKMMGPTGTGILYGKQEELEKLEPFILGGETVTNSTQEGYELEDIPHRFEAGLQNYAGFIGLAQAAKYLDKIGLSSIQKHEQKLNNMITDELKDEVTVHGPQNRGGIFSFTIKNNDVHDMAMMLDSMARICTRSGQHCNHSWCNKQNIQGTTRASLYAYNTQEEAETFIEVLKKIVKDY